MNFVLFEIFWLGRYHEQTKTQTHQGKCMPVFIQQEQKIRKPPENNVMCMYAISHFLNCKVLPQCCLFQLQLDKTDGITRLAPLMVTNNDFY